MALCAGAYYPGIMTVKFFAHGLPMAIAVLRAVTAWRLWDGTWPYVSRLNSMQDVTSFFESLYIPLPMLSAYLSVYIQFIGSILLFVGWQTRITAFLLVINFSVALLAAHLHDPISKSFQAWALWAIAIFFLFNGAGKYSLDDLEQNYKNR
jgi:putative oxidoreductase